LNTTPAPSNFGTGACYQPVIGYDLTGELEFY
jgi:hypothetical protein